ncbi:Coenzyme F420 hydrogenase/dehydrogenase, beta subunit C-terminal domain [Erythrobacter crassostreae]|nr:Coenzyme F420 hydrogenase/dehydrogenase, beta subunit C-terminal domain [Erythrobacter crassostrea]
MIDAENGFRRPEQRTEISAIQASLIDQACPGVNIRHEPAEHEAEYHAIWGPLIKARLGWSSDVSLRHRASSGGGLSAILLHLLEHGEVDYVLHTSVSEHSPIRNSLAISTGRDDVFHAAGSRYAPSSPLEDIGARLDGPKRFAFVGKPCDVAALRQLARHDPRVDEKVPYMIAFMCAGVPSHHGTSQLLREMGVEDESDIKEFRYRGDGWPGYATAQMSGGSKLSMDYDTSWGSILNRHLQFRCKICPDGVGEFADIVCADGWYCDESGEPVFEESEGRSIVMTRTKRGEALVSRAIDEGHLIAEHVTVEEIANMQPYQARRKGLVLSRLAAMVVSGRRTPRFENLELAQNARLLGLIGNLRSMLGTLRRLLSKQEAG